MPPIIKNINLNNVQEKLVSGTNIKTVNGQTLLGFGNITTTSGFRGNIVIADSPTLDGTYRPTEAGTYPNAGGLVFSPLTTDKGFMVDFIKSGVSWTKSRVDIGFDTTDIDNKIKLLGIPGILMTKASALNTVKKRPTNTGLVDDIDALSTDYIEVLPGDIVNCLDGLGIVSFYNATKDSRVTAVTPAVAPVGYPFVVITFGYLSTGSFNNAYAQIITSVEARKIGAKAVNFLTNQESNNPLLVENAQLSSTKYNSQPKLVYDGNMFDKSSTTPGLVTNDLGVITIVPNAGYVTKKINIYGKKLETKICLKGVRVYALVGQNDVVRILTYIDQSLQVNVDIESSDCFLYVSVPVSLVNTALVGYGTTLPIDSPYRFDLEFDGKRLLKDFVGVPPEGGAYVVRTLEKNFKYGTMSGAGVVVSSYHRSYKRVPLEVGTKYTFIIGAGYTRLTSFTEDQFGVKTSFNSPVVTGSSSVVAYWIVVKRTDDGAFTSEEVTKLPVEKEYRQTESQYLEYLESQTEDLEIQDELQNSNNTLQLDKLSKENEVLSDKLLLLGESLKNLYDVRVGSPYDDVTLPLVNTDGGKLIINLHRKANNGYSTSNDVYLPNAKEDFSDVKITDNLGSTLPTRVVYTGNVDIIADSRLAGESMIHSDDTGKMYARKSSVICSSIDEGKTWTPISVFSDLTNATVAHVTSNNVMFVGNAGKLYRSEAPYITKSMVLDFTTFYPDSIILSHSMVQHPDGELFIGSYQVTYDTRYFKSTDEGLTWVLNKRIETTYQHCHNMSIDLNQTPVAIYTGLDGGGGVFKTTDKGNTWVDLRAANPNMLQSSDYGVIYSDPTGYRLIGGETSIVGGSSIIKTTDDSTYRAVMSNGQGVYFIQRLGNKLFAGALSSTNFYTGSILISEDEGETWVTAYQTGLYDVVGASNAFRYLSKGTYLGSTEEQIIAGNQSSTGRPSLRIYEGGNHYFSSIIVDVPAGATEIKIGSGYIASSRKDIVNNSSTGLVSIFKAPLNENSPYSVFEDRGTQHVVKTDFNYNKGGKKLGNIYPLITEPTENFSAKLKLYDYRKVNVDLTGSNFHVGFWFTQPGIPSYSTNILRSTGFIFDLFVGYRFRINEIDILTMGKIYDNVPLRIDINFRPDGFVELYLNGFFVSQSAVSHTSKLAVTNGIFTVLEETMRVGVTPNNAIQGFELNHGNINSSKALDLYYNGLTDNVII